MRQACPSCGGTRWAPFLTSTSGLILTGDQRIEPGTLDKVICADCGVVANARPLSVAELETLYGDAYQLNTLGREEHLFFTADGPKPRSGVIFDWIAAQCPPDARRIVEIGSGEGNVLSRFAARFPLAEVLGIEGSQKAAALARDKGLDVRADLIVSSDHALPEADVLFSYAVLEHVEDVAGFLSVLRAACRPGGRIIFGLPVQDDWGHDLFFAEHVWHFTSAHVRRVLHRHGLRVIHAEPSHPVNKGAGLFVCVPDDEVSAPVPDPAETAALRAVQARNRDYWMTAFDRLNHMLAETPGPIAVYGASEILSLLLSQTGLRDAPIAYCVDEDPSKVGLRKHGIAVYAPDHLAVEPVSAVFLTANPRYNTLIAGKLAGCDVPLKIFLPDT